MYALIAKTPDEAHCLAVCVIPSPLEEKLKEEANNFLKERMEDDEIEKLGYKESIEKATTFWTDDDDEYPYTLFIEETDLI